MALFDNLLAGFIILAIMVIAYCKITNKTLKDLIIEIKNGFTEEVE